jgi:SAM-dependent methyltransferase
MAALDAGTREHYEDARLYDHEYGRRREDVAYYRRIADQFAPRGGAVLELGCGSGRITLPLVKDGHEVVGVDLSAQMLATLEKKAARLTDGARRRLKIVQGDFLGLNLRRRFPLVISPFNALMHCYTRRDMELLLSVVRKHLAPGGRFVFDVMNPDLPWLSRDSTKRWARTRFRHPQTGAWMVYSTDLTFDTPMQVAFMRIYYEKLTDGKKSSRARVVRLAHRYFFPRELEALLHYNGFVIESHDGDFDGEPLATDSEMQVCVCRTDGRVTSSRRKTY